MTSKIFLLFYETDVLKNTLNVVKGTKTPNATVQITVLMFHRSYQILFLYLCNQLVPAVSLESKKIVLIFEYFLIINALRGQTNCRNFKLGNEGYRS